VGNGGDRGVLRHTDNAGKVRGKPVRWRRTWRRDSLRGGVDGDALVRTGEATMVFSSGANQQQPRGVKEVEACLTWRGKHW
jgi:hypothetical protein